MFQNNSRIRDHKQIINVLRLFLYLNFSLVCCIYVLVNIKQCIFHFNEFWKLFLIVWKHYSFAIFIIFIVPLNHIYRLPRILHLTQMQFEWKFGTWERYDHFCFLFFFRFFFVFLFQRNAERKTCRWLQMLLVSETTGDESFLNALRT